MYMERIVAAPVAAKPVVSPALRMSVGIPVLLLSLLVMLPWLGATATVAVITLGLRTLFQMIDYAGSVALGR